MTNLCEGIQLECQNTKDWLFKSLDTYLAEYREGFKQYQIKFASVFTLTQNY
jgi:hypothetical protein